MTTLSSLPPRPPKILLWGKPGTGKTPFVTSFGQGLQFLDADDGLKSSLTLKDSWATERLKIDVLQFLESTPDKANAFVDLRTYIQRVVYPQCALGTYPYDLLAIDSFTQVADYALRYIAGNSGKLSSMGAISQQMWGLAIAEIDMLFSYIKALPIPVVTIFHDREATEGSGDSAVTFSEISIFGKNLPRKIISYFGEVVRQRVRTVSGKMEPYLQTIPDSVTVVRSRSAVPDGFLTSLGFREFLKLLGWGPKEIAEWRDVQKKKGGLSQAPAIATPTATASTQVVNLK